MIALYVILGIVLLFAVILSLYIRIFLEYNGEIIKLNLQIGPVRLRLLPKKKKKLPYKKLAKKLRGKKLSTMKPKKKKAKKENKLTDVKLETLIEDLSKNSKNPALTKIVLNTIKEFTLRFRHKLHSRIERFIITVDGKEASATCIQTALISQGVTYFIELLDNFTQLTPIKKDSVAVIPSFDGQGYRFDLKGDFKVRIASILAAFVSAAFKSMTEDINQNANVQTRKDIKQ